MSKSRTSKRDLYYTNRHDWIDFQGSVAYIGACLLKLNKLPEVRELQFTGNSGFAKAGEVVMRIECADSSIPIHMPVDGKIISINEVLLEGNHQLLIDQPENNGWVALIVPSKPYERIGLMQPEQYKQFVKQQPRNPS
jgi:glycine cleavage system H protein